LSVRDAATDALKGKKEKKEKKEISGGAGEARTPDLRFRKTPYFSDPF
jgi:hypothetical protein